MAKQNKTICLDPEAIKAEENRELKRENQKLKTLLKKIKNTSEFSVEDNNNMADSMEDDSLRISNVTFERFITEIKEVLK